MKILIDLQSCQSGSRFGGIGRYSLALAKAMIRVGHWHDFYVLLNKSLPYENDVRASSFTAIPIQQSADILTAWKKERIVAIDEAQFFDEGLIDVCNELARQGV